MTKQIGVGVIGCGYWGPNLVRNFDNHPEWTLKALCDLDENRLRHMQGLYPKVETYRDYAQMLDKAHLDAVAIAVPVKAHFPVAKACLMTGHHVLIEKPMAASSTECEELIDIARRKRLTLMVGHTFLYSEPVRRIAEIVSRGEIGELQYINCQRLNLGLFQNDINVAWDLAPHDISIILHIFGELPEVINCQGNAHVTPGIEDVTNMSLGFGRRRFATIQSSWLEPRKVRQMTFVGSRRMIVYNDLSPTEAIRIYDVRVERPPFYDSFAEFHYSYYHGDSYIPHIKLEEPLKRMVQHFLDCIRTGAQPLSCGEKGLELVRVLEASSESLKASGGPVKYAGGPNGHSLPARNRVARKQLAPV